MGERRNFGYNDHKQEEESKVIKVNPESRIIVDLIDKSEERSRITTQEY